MQPLPTKKELSRGCSWIQAIESYGRNEVCAEEFTICTHKPFAIAFNLAVTHLTR